MGIYILVRTPVTSSKLSRIVNILLFISLFYLYMFCSTTMIISCVMNYSSAAGSLRNFRLSAVAIDIYT